MKKLLIVAVLMLAACTDERPGNLPPAGPITPTDCPPGTTSPDCVWPDGRPK